MKKTLPLILIAIAFGLKSFAQNPVPIVPVTNCPDANLAIVRAGLNADINNPTHIYSVNTVNGAFTLLPGGPLRYPDNPAQPLHVNGIGINKTDGLIYGLALEGTFNTARFVRFGTNYGSHLISNIPPPTSPTGPLGFVNAAAGDVDRLNNYYFTGFTMNTFPVPNLDKFYLGKISNISTLSSAAIPQYFEIDISEASCTGYLASFVTDPENSGLKDLTFSPFTNTFFGYVTYKPAGAADYTGQMIEFRPIPGSSPLKYKMYCKTILNTHSSETSGTLIDKFGTFFIMFTNGTVGRSAFTGSPLNYSGAYVSINTNTGLPSVLRGDLGSCGESEGALPVTLLSFDGTGKDCKTNFTWAAENEINFSRYELQQSLDNVNYQTIGVVAKKTGNRNEYNYSIASPSKQASYRLKMIDTDNKVYYSSIRNINNSCSKISAGFVINPNPVINMLNLNWYGMPAKTQAVINIYNVYGSQVRSITASIAEGNSISNINVADLPSGTYVIKVVGKQNNVSMEGRFVKP